MAKNIITLLTSAAILVLIASCAHNYTPSTVLEAPGQTHEPCAREQLVEMGFQDEMLDSFAEGGISFESVVNQQRFIGFTDSIYNNQPIGPSGETILRRYFGGMHFDNNGMLTVTVLAGAFDHAASATAIDEMRELGIIVNIVDFSHHEQMGAINALNNVHQGAAAAGATSWGIGALNRIELQLDPYSEEQLAIFEDFLLSHSINPAMILITPAVTQEMRDSRAERIAAVAMETHDQIIQLGDAIVSQTGIAFSKQNRTCQDFNYGSPWDLAYYTNGAWAPVQHLPGADGGMWTLEGRMLQPGGILHYRQEWAWRFGELPPGRYMFIRSGWLGEWSDRARDHDNVYAIVEFFITENCPVNLPPPPQDEWRAHIAFIQHSNVTPHGMTILVENISDYDIDHIAQIDYVVPAIYVTSDYWWQWQQHILPFLPIEGDWSDYFIQGEGFLPSGGQLEFTFNWKAILGELPPGEYVISLGFSGHAHPPHPTGWVSGSSAMFTFIVG